MLVECNLMGIRMYLMIQQKRIEKLPAAAAITKPPPSSFAVFAFLSFLSFYKSKFIETESLP